MIARFDSDCLQKIYCSQSDRAEDITQSQIKTQLQHSVAPRSQSSACEDIICDFFVAYVKKEQPDLVLKTFSDFFIEQNDRIPAALKPTFSNLLVQDREKSFIAAINRCCYILINHWIAAANRHNIQRLIDLFLFIPPSLDEASPLQAKSRQWLDRFLASEQWLQIQNFALRYTQTKSENHSRESERWHNRYSYYLLSEQYTNLNNPREQREAAKLASRQIGQKFKFNLAMYLAHSQSILGRDRAYENPTHLSDRVLNLIHKTLTKRKRFDYRNLANIFGKQTEGIPFKNFKQSLLKYLLFSLKKNSTSAWLQTYLSGYLDTLYPDYDDCPLDAKLLLRTCNRLIELLTEPDLNDPNNILTLLAIQRNYLTWAVILLKIILISPSSYNRLVARTATLIQLYEARSESDCQWLIRFLETLTVVLAIAFDGASYSLDAPASSSTQ